MRNHSARRSEAGEAIPLLIILLLLALGGCWYLYSARKTAEKDALDFARLAVERIGLHQDEKFLQLRLGPEAQVKYPPAWRSRMFARLRDLGTPSGVGEVKGTVAFTSYFFSPTGSFKGQVNFPAMPAYVDLTISHPKALWQIDEINMRWHLAPD